MTFDEWYYGEGLSCQRLEKVLMQKAWNAAMSARTEEKALAVLIDLHKLMDFDQPCVAGEAVIFDDPSDLNAVFARAYALIEALPSPQTPTARPEAVTPMALNCARRLLKEQTHDSADGDVLILAREVIRLAGDPTVPVPAKIGRGWSAR